MTAITPSGVTASELLAPGTGLAGGIYALYLIVKLYRDGRREQVLAARSEAEKANQRADDAERERTSELADMRAQINALERELIAVRAEMREQRQSHDQQLREERDTHAAELAEAHRQRLVELRVSHRLIQWCIEQECGLPPDLDPARHDIEPALGHDVVPPGLHDKERGGG